MKKAQFQFAWIFAVIVGALILFLAFYFAGTFLLQQRHEQTTVETQFLDIITDPFSYLGSMGATTYKQLELPKEYEIIIECSTSTSMEMLGKNTITLMEKNEAGIQRNLYNKYLYFEQPFKAKKINALSKPFEMPWRVSDIIIFWPADQEYCFVDAPFKIKNEVERLEIETIKTETKKINCEENAITVCFEGGNCDVVVYDSKIEKDDGTIYYTGDALMYAGIFSDKLIYDCNLKRLASRLNTQALIYEEKSLSLLQKGCSISYNLQNIKEISSQIADPNKFISATSIENLQKEADALGRANSNYCTLF